MAVPVVVFNTNFLPVQVNVNNAMAAFTINGASAPSWAPQIPATGGPSWSNTQASANTFAPGKNYVQITPQGVNQPVTFTVDLPSANIQWNSLQLYIYFDSYTNVSWIVLNSGQYVTGNISLKAGAQAAGAAVS